MFGSRGCGYSAVDADVETAGDQTENASSAGGDASRGWPVLRSWMCCMQNSVKSIMN